MAYGAVCWDGNWIWVQSDRDSGRPVILAVITRHGRAPGMNVMEAPEVHFTASSKKGITVTNTLSQGFTSILL